MILYDIKPDYSVFFRKLSFDKAVEMSFQMAKLLVNENIEDALSKYKMDKLLYNIREYGVITFDSSDQYDRVNNMQYFLNEYNKLKFEV